MILIDIYCGEKRVGASNALTLLCGSCGARVHGSGSPRTSFGVCSLALILASGCVLSSPARAEDAILGGVWDAMSAVLDKDTGREVWTGVDVTEQTWLVFSGFTYAPQAAFSTTVRAFALMSGYGAYDFDEMRPTGETSVSVQKTYVDLLVGYQQRISELTAKIFAGVSFISHNAGEFDGSAPLSGDDVGIKALVELWLNIGQKGWASLDAAWAQPFNTTNVRARIGSAC